MKKIKEMKWGWLVLFASMSTLLCCALPIVLVTLGMGAVMASIATNVPFLIVLSQNKIWTFIVSGVFLIVGAWALYRKNRTCPVDKELGAACASAHKWNKRLFWMSIVLWIIGFFTSYALLPVLEWLGI